MKNFRNDGSEQYTIQNEFTAYLQIAIRRAKARYLSKQNFVLRHEIAKDSQQMSDTSQEQGRVAHLNSADFIELGIERIELTILLTEMLSQLSEREVAILKGKVFDERTFDELATRLELDISTVKSIYYRSLKKLRNLLND